jgi:Ca2+-transporting ATPase
MVGILIPAMLVGVLAPAVLRAVENGIWQLNIPFGMGLITSLFELVRLLLPTAVLFCGFSAFYKLAPRRPTAFKEVWPGALLVAISIQVLQFFFILYARNIAGNKFNAVYGAFGSVIALLMWIYLSGSVVIFGACFCAVRAEMETADAAKDSAVPLPPSAD